MILIKALTIVLTPVDGFAHSSGIVIVPSSICFCISWAFWPFTEQPMEKAVPKTSFTVPTSFLAMDFCLSTRAIAMIASNVTLPECLMFFTFFLSLGGSFSSFIIIADAVGTIVGVAYALAVVAHIICSTELYVRRKDSYHTIDYAQSNHNFYAFPFHSCFLDIFTDLFWWLFNQRNNWWSHIKKEIATCIEIRSHQTERT